VEVVISGKKKDGTFGKPGSKEIEQRVRRGKGGGSPKNYLSRDRKKLKGEKRKSPKREWQGLY